MRKWLKIEKIDPDDINIDVRTELKNKGFPIIESMLAGIYNVWTAIHYIYLLIKLNFIEHFFTANLVQSQVF